MNEATIDLDPDDEKEETWYVHDDGDNDHDDANHDHVDGHDDDGHEDNDHVDQLDEGDLLPLVHHSDRPKGSVDYQWWT